MFVFIAGLLLFLGVHSVRIVAEDWRTTQRASLGENTWKMTYSLVSLIGFAVLVWGYGMARQQPLVVWTPPNGMRHLAGLLILAAFILLVAAYVPRNGIKARVHHPMILGVKLWAAAHLLANGTLADMLLFGSFLVWAIFSFKATRQRDRVTGVVYPAGTATGTITVVAIGIAAWALFAFWLHGMLIGVKPFAMAVAPQ
jgi:uncharacterized membrane protein